jgi:protein-disulfide isomerase
MLFLAATAAAQGVPPGSPSKAEIQKKVETFLRKVYAWGPSFRVEVGEPAPSTVPSFYQVNVVVTVGSESDSRIMYVSRDGRHLIQGDVLDTTEDPFAENRKKITLDGSPSIGPENAPIIVVEFSDFQCPHCRLLDQALRQLRTQYPQVRFVSKHFPLGQIHSWADTAHLAAECALLLKPDAYWTVHNRIFDQQEQLTAENVWQRLLDTVTAAGIDPDSYRTCMTAPASKDHILRDLKEGQLLRIANTPTVFVNGRRIVGGDPRILRQYLEYELAAHKPQ